MTTADAFVRNALLGIFIALIWYLGNWIWLQIRSGSEGARRFRIVGGIAVAAITLSILFSAMGLFGAFISSMVIAAVIWIRRGYKYGNTENEDSAFIKEPQTSNSLNTKSPARSREIGREERTIITCPQCQKRLRVVAGKYIDVTCPHCKTIFRTHT